MKIYDRIKDILNGVKDPIVFEFGAYNGSDSHNLAKIMNYEGKLFSWEISPANIDLIKSKGMPKNCELIESAISDKDGKDQFYVAYTTNKHYAAQSSLLKPIKSPNRPNYVKFNNPIIVNTRSLDSFCKERNIDHIDFIWADIQGAEPLMIKGGQNILRSTKYTYLELIRDARYKNMILDVNELRGMLPGTWELVERYPEDVLFMNTSQ